MKLYKDYTNKPFPFLVNDMTLSSNNPLRFMKNYKMNVSEKIRKNDNKIEQNKAQHDLGRQTANISALSSGNVNKYKLKSNQKI